MKVDGKLSPRALGWDRDTISAAIKKITPSDRVLIGRFGGVVAGLKMTENAKDGSVQIGLKGNFRGISSILDGKGEPIRSESGVCYIPGGIQEMIEGNYSIAREQDKNATVTFLVDLYAIHANNPVGYTFTAETVVEPGENNQLDMLFEQGDNVPLIENRKDK